MKPYFLGWFVSKEEEFIWRRDYCFGATVLKDILRLSIFAANTEKTVNKRVGYDLRRHFGLILNEVYIIKITVELLV